MKNPGTYAAVVMGASAGGLTAFTELFVNLPSAYALPIIAVQHRIKDGDDLFEEILSAKCPLPVRQAEEKEAIRPGVIYVAPPDYHLLIEDDMTFSLSSTAPVNYSRPSIDMLFESAADALKNRVVAVLLSGANSDGSAGMMAVYDQGGKTIAQDPDEARHPTMVSAAIATGKVRHIWRLKEIAAYLRSLDG